MSSELLLATLIKAISPTVMFAIKSGLKIFKNQTTEWDIRQSAERLARHTIDINTVKTLWEKDKGILIDSFYYPLKLTLGRHSLEFSEIEVGFTEKAIVEGVVGQGKSILLRHLCIKALKSGFIPIFIELRSITKEAPLEKLIYEHLDISGLEGTPETFDYLAKNGKINIILDGYDEVTPGMNNAVISSIERLRKKYEGLGIIISSRPFHDIQSLAGFHVYSLASLGEEDHEGFLRRLIPETSRRFLITDAISNAPENIKGVITTPLMLTLLVIVYESESEIPSTLPDFFEKLFSTVFSRHDRLKAGFERRHFSKLSESKLQKLFDAFCFMLVQDVGSRSIKSDDFKHAFDKAQRYTQDAKCEVEDFRNDIIKVACLMLEDGIGLDTFLHKSIMEYHAASFIKNSSDPISSQFYMQVDQDFSKWSPILMFLSNIDSYRYARDYILKTYPPQLIEISDLLTKKTQEGLITYLNDRLPNLLFGVGSHELRSLSLGRPQRNYYDALIIRGLFDTASTQISEDNRLTTYRATRETPVGIHNARGEGVLGISIRAFIENFDENEVWTILKNVEQDMISQINKYKVIVDAEDKKHEIFA